MSRTYTHSDIDVYAGQIKADREAGHICIGASLLLTAEEIRQDAWAAVEATVHEKAQQAAKALAASALTLAQPQWQAIQDAKAQQPPPEPGEFVVADA